MRVALRTRDSVDDRIFEKLERGVFGHAGQAGQRFEP